MHRKVSQCLPVHRTTSEINCSTRPFSKKKKRKKKNKTQTPDLFLKEPQNLIPRLPNPFKSTPLSKISKYARIQFQLSFPGFTQTVKCRHYTIPKLQKMEVSASLKPHLPVLEQPKTKQHKTNVIAKAREAKDSFFCAV